MRRVPFGREVSPDLTPFEIRKKRGSGHKARRCNAQDTTTTSTSTSTPWTTPTWSSTSTTSSSPPVLKEHQKHPHYDAPTTTTSSWSPSPTTTTTPWTSPTTTTHYHEPSPTTTQGGGGGGGTGTFSGDGTFYGTGSNACGGVDHDTDFICAAAHGLFDSYPGATGNPNNNPICGKKLTAHYQGKSVTVKVTDRCGGCEGNSLDFSPAAFKQIADPNLGRIQMTWSWD